MGHMRLPTVSPGGEMENTPVLLDEAPPVEPVRPRSTAAGPIKPGPPQKTKSTRLEGEPPRCFCAQHALGTRGA
eukprot:4644757-Amphidinium_carterae.1